MGFRLREIWWSNHFVLYLQVSFHADHREAYFAGIFFGLHEPGSGYAGECQGSSDNIVDAVNIRIQEPTLRKQSSRPDNSLFFKSREKNSTP